MLPGSPRARVWLPVWLLASSARALAPGSGFARAQAAPAAALPSALGIIETKERLFASRDQGEILQGGNGMKKTFLFALLLLLSVSLFACANRGTESQPRKEGPAKEEPREVPREVPREEPQRADQTDEAAVASLVKEFGSKLQTVSLQAPKDVVNKSMQENYGDLVSPALIAEWLKDLPNAPGRMLSSPWPDRIEILSVEKLSETYQVRGQIIEITSVEKVSGGAAAKRPITLTVKKTGDRWLVDAVALGAYEATDSILYRSTQYGFVFSLPESWKGYSIVTDKWEGAALRGPQSGKIVETGPIVSIRHPQWTSQNPRQDIPIMIFTLAQWRSLQRGEFHIGAAPVGPSELGRNTRDVFALPARYNYAFPTGYEEVEEILKSNPLHPAP